MAKRHELGVLGEAIGDRGELEAGDPAHEGNGSGVRSFEIGHQVAQFTTARCPVEAAESHVDRVDRTPADHLHDPVAGLLEVQHLGHQLGVLAGDRDPRVDAEEVGRVKEGHVQDVALDPLAAVEQPSQVADRTVDGDACEAFDRVGGAHLVGNGADPADARGDVDGLVVGPAAQERLEHARRLVDLEPHVLDHAVANDDVHRAFALDPGERRDMQVERLVRHGRAPSDATREKASTSNVRMRRSIASGSTPRWRS